MYISSFPTDLSVYILTKSEFISSCIRPAVGSTVFKSLAQLFLLLFFKWAWIYIKLYFFFKWPPVAILDVQKSLLIALSFHRYATLFFLEIFDKMAARRPFWMSEIHFRSHFWSFQIDIQLYFFLEIFDKMAAVWMFGCPKFIFNCWPFHIDTQHFFFLEIFDKMAAVGHFGCPTFTFDRISGHFRSIRIFFLQNGRRRTFWMFENHFWLHFWPFQIDRPFWMSEIHFR